MNGRSRDAFFGKANAETNFFNIEGGLDHGEFHRDHDFDHSRIHVWGFWPFCYHDSWLYYGYDYPWYRCYYYYPPCSTVYVYGESYPYPAYIDTPEYVAPSGSVDQRRQAADALAKQPGTQSVAALIDTLVNDNDARVRADAAESLGKLNDRMAGDFLQWVAENDTDKSVQRETHVAIEKIGNTIN
jgi:hypothetical protein